MSKSFLIIFYDCLGEIPNEQYLKNYKPAYTKLLKVLFIETCLPFLLIIIWFLPTNENLDSATLALTNFLL